MVLNIFSRAHWLFVYLLWKNVYAILCSFFKLRCFLFCYWRNSYIFWILTSYQIYNLQLFSDSTSCLFYSKRGHFCVLSIPLSLSLGICLSPSQSAYSILLATMIYLPKDVYRAQTGPVKIHLRAFLQRYCKRCTLALVIMSVRNTRTTILITLRKNPNVKPTPGKQSWEVQPWWYFWSVWGAELPLNSHSWVFSFISRTRLSLLSSSPFSPLLPSRKGAL